MREFQGRIRDLSLPRSPARKNQIDYGKVENIETYPPPLKTPKRKLGKVNRREYSKETRPPIQRRTGKCKTGIPYRLVRRPWEVRRIILRNPVNQGSTTLVGP